MRLYNILSLLVAVGISAAMPTRLASNCTTVEIRREWRNLTTAEKHAYLQADVCLMNLPGRTILEGVTDRYSDLVAIHQNLTGIIHGNGQFLPYHRWYLHTHEYLMRSECNYTGPMTWWDESLDTADFGASPLFTSEFWGSLKNATNGSDVCVTDGYFGNRTLTIGPLQTFTERCFARNLNITASASTSAEAVANCNTITDYELMRECIGPGAHTGGHLGVGGAMGDIDTSPNDPLFMMHHGFIDRNWWNWQQLDPETRTYELDGYTTTSAPYTNVTLDYEMTTWGILPNITITDVMDTQGGYLCYVYDY